MAEPPKPASGQGAFTEQEQFLAIATREEAIARFDAAFDARPLGVETVALDVAPGRILAADLAAPIDTPPFDRSVVDGFALRAADAAGASEGRPLVLALNPERLACGTAPRLAVTPGTATPIATGAPIPRGADCVVMIEHSEPAGAAGIAIRRAPAPGQNIAFAGSDIARGQMLLHAGTRIGAREIGMIAAIGLAAIPVFRRPRVAVISTGDELVAPGAPLRPAAIHDSNGPVIAAALAENGCVAVRHGAIPDDPAQLEAAIRAAHADCDAVIL
ncbi:MAG: molybdopterin-binding protein, partial [Rhabdaerophilum calidifontis]